MSVSSPQSTQGLEKIGAQARCESKIVWGNLAVPAQQSEQGGMDLEGLPEIIN
jgi:hypothetical protein